MYSYSLGINVWRICFTESRLFVVIEATSSSLDDSISAVLFAVTDSAP